MTTGDLEDFIGSIVALSNHIKRIDPDVIIYPIRGAVPIADLLRIIDPTIASRHEEYMPASSSIVDTDNVIFSRFQNFLKEQHVRGQKLSVVTIDEVITGMSVFRVQKQMLRAIRQYAHEKGLPAGEEVQKTSLALQQTYFPHSGPQMQRTYLKLVAEGVVIPIPVQKNIVMDQPELCPVKLMKLPDHPKGVNLPVMQDYTFSEAYLDLLAKVGASRGVDISTIAFQNPAKIKASERFLPDAYKSPEAYNASRR